MSAWTNSKDSVQRTDLRVTFRLDVDELAALLAHTMQGDERPVATLPATQIRELIAGELHAYGLCNLPDADATNETRDAVIRAYGAPGGRPLTEVLRGES